MTTQQCLVLIKPDGIIKSLTGDIILKLSEVNLKIVGAKIVNVQREFAEKHYHKLKSEQIAKYGEKKGTKIYEDTLKYILGEFHTKRIMALVYEGEDSIAKIRKLAGATNPEEAEPTTIRGKYGRIHSTTGVFENVMHASEEPEDAEREIKLWFSPDELINRIYPHEVKKEAVEHCVWK